MILGRSRPTNGHADISLQRLMRYFAIGDPKVCWEWMSVRTRGGYGEYSSVQSGKRIKYVGHRGVYTVFRGEIPPGLQLDHLCRNRGCVNPWHLEPVTSQENSRRGDAGINMRRKTHCPKGHEYNEENTYRNKRGHRTCRTCHR